MNRTRPVAIVTGAARGIGAAVSRALAAEGYHVVATARRKEQVEDFVENAHALGQSAEAGTMDVSDASSVNSFFEKLKTHGPAAILVNNAGVLGPIGPIANTDPGEWEKCIEVNLIGTYRCLRLFADQLSPEVPATVVNISSGAALNYFEGWSAYCASKAGLAMVTRAAAQELRGRAYVYGFQPGVVDTGMMEQVRALRINCSAEIPRWQLLSPEVPARIAAWLCRERPDDLNGTEFRADDVKILTRAGLE